MNHIELGRYGEELAVKYLLDRGYEIIEQNIRYRFGEVDVLAKEEDTLVVIEVKTRRTDAYGLPCEAVNWKKRQHIRRVISLFLATEEISYDILRFDVIEVYVREQAEPCVRHLKGCKL